ncbi:MAG: (d)CMP kinase [Chromatiaceae bacterium]
MKPAMVPSGPTQRIPIVTLDGPSGTGKGTIASLLATRLGWHCLDSGALYRVLGLAAERTGIDLEAGGALAYLAAGLQLAFREGRVLLDGEDVTEAIRTETVGNAASRVATHGPVRDALLAWQREAVRPPGLVADGRDMGTVVFPGAPVKIFLTASPEERGQRRFRQLREKGQEVNLPQLVRDIAERDERDSQRAVAPLRPAADALVVDTTGINIEGVLEQVLAVLRDRLGDLEAVAR